jgi:inhibitor of KinA
MSTAARGDVRFAYASDQSLLVRFGEQMTLQAHQQVVRLLRLLETEPVSGVRNLHPAYCSLLVKFDPLKLTHKELQGILGARLDRAGELRLPEPRLVEIPVCYDAEFAADLNEVAELHRLTPQQAADLHCSATYTVFFLGFVPGFAYLGELPEALVTPRLSAPRRSVPPGSVGIAGRQTGVYPFATPGGWRLIGRTPTRMFQPEADSMSVLSIGDRVRFVPISRERFAALEKP